MTRHAPRRPALSTGAAGARRRIGRGAATIVAASFVLGAAAVVPAWADPTAPSADDVREAQERESSIAGSVADLEVELATLGTKVAAAQQEASRAGEEYLTATVALESAQTEADRAGARRDTAVARMEESRKVLAGVALEQYRSGGAMKNVEAILSADGITEVIERTSSLSVVGSVADAAVQQYRADSLVAQSLQAQAAEALETRQRAAGAADAALAATEAKQEAAQEALAAAQARRSDLITALAAARSTTTELETQRQDALDAARAEREEREAERARTQAPAAPATQAPTPPRTASPTRTPTPTRAPATTSPTQTPTQAPATQAPATQAPTQAPATQAPATTAPATQAPTQAPTSQPPATTAPPASGPALGHGVSVGSAAQGAAAVAWAKTKVGLPYGWGSTGPDAYDCSGLTMQAWAAQGVGITRTSRSQYMHVKLITYAQMRPGDLIFYGSDPNDPASITHVAMFAGGGMMVEAARPGVPLRVTPVRYSGSMTYAGRP